MHRRTCMSKSISCCTQIYMLLTHVLHQRRSYCCSCMPDMCMRDVGTSMCSPCAEYATVWGAHWHGGGFLCNLCHRAAHWIPRHKQLQHNSPGHHHCCYSSQHRWSHCDLPRGSSPDSAAQLSGASHARAEKDESLGLGEQVALT